MHAMVAVMWPVVTPAAPMATASTAAMAAAGRRGSGNHQEGEYKHKTKKHFLHVSILTELRFAFFFPKII